jgi:GTPase SAR1 family protein
LRDANCAVFVYDVSRQNSFDGLTEWIQMFDNYKRKDSIMVIVGNKIDIK